MAKPQHLPEPDWLIDTVERWLIPCTDALPPLCHGLCRTLPPVFAAAIVIGAVAILSYLCGSPDTETCHTAACTSNTQTHPAPCVRSEKKRKATAEAAATKKSK